MIATQSVELRAGARLLVKDVAVRINSGDRIGFVGRNGAGKSTLAKCDVIQVEAPSRGENHRNATSPHAKIWDMPPSRMSWRKKKLEWMKKKFYAV